MALVYTKFYTVSCNEVQSLHPFTNRELMFPHRGVLKLQTICVQKEILHSHDDKSFIISPWFFASIYNNNLFERVRDITQRIEFLSLFFFRSHVISNLDIVSLVPLIHHKVNLQLPANTLAIFILIKDIHDTHINIVATNQQLVINNVLHDMSRLLLSEIQTGIPQPQISKVIFQICADILSSLNVVSIGLGNQKGI